MRLQDPERLGDPGHQYLAAIYAELQAVKSLLAKIAGETAVSEPQPGELIDLREPARQYTPLPEDFPGRDALLAEGIDALEDVPRTGAALTAVNGVGKVTANQILTWFKVNS